VARAEGSFDAEGADLYKYRTPYSSGFFTKLAGALPCRPETRLLDIACGTGVLSVGMEKFVGSITAMDSSADMLAIAPRHPKITYLHGDLNAEPLRSPRVDHVMIGRAIHWLEPEKLRASLDSVLAPEGRIAICSSGLAGQVPWVGEFQQLRRQYESRREMNITHSDAMKRLPAIGLQPLGRIVDQVTTRAKPDVIFRHALAYGTSRFEILADEARFKERLAAIIRPAMRDGLVEIPIVSWAVIFGRGAGNAASGAATTPDSIWD
jgi:SAM-dependent methyltransferase